ncbi:MAG: TlpA family protein disulfide reductase [Rhodocyclales bacterium]|nr:TlpA family protein disulfide reductase [Rhodocyclales bacterium]
MKSGRVGLLLAGLALLIAGIAYHLVPTGKTNDVPAPTAAQTAIFDLVLTDVDGKAQSFQQWRGKILVLNYWATWCFPCREEMPGFSRLQLKYQDKGVQFVGISIDDAAKIVEFLKETPVSYPLLIGDMKTMTNSAELGNSRQALPFTAVFDRNGQLVMSRLGRWNEADLEPRLLDLISR